MFAYSIANLPILICDLIDCLLQQLLGVSMWAWRAAGTCHHLCGRDGHEHAGTRDFNSSLLGDEVDGQHMCMPPELASCFTDDEEGLCTPTESATQCTSVTMTRWPPFPPYWVFPFPPQACPDPGQALLHLNRSM